VFAQRKAMVEPVFSMLRERQGLNRFRRRGRPRPPGVPSALDGL
jgi:hypothetical protein